MPPLGWGDPAPVRFWRLVQRGSRDDCWLWTGAVVGIGYGQFTSDGRLPSGRKKPVKAHRFSWELANGPIPPGIQVLHRCDNPPCVNPDHLFLGTHDDNMADQCAKDRHPRFHGDSNPSAKLTPHIVRRIRATPEISNSEWARRLGMHNVTISEIRRRKIWKNV